MNTLQFFYGYRLCEHKSHGGNHKGIDQCICYMILATLTSWCFVYSSHHSMCFIYVLIDENSPPTISVIKMSILQRKVRHRDVKVIWPDHTAQR